VLILTRDSAVPYLHSVTVAPVTSAIRNIPSEVRLSQADGLAELCVVNCDNIQTVPKTGLKAHITHLSENKMRIVRRAVEFALGFDALA
jgi:mRNA interferase MazF